MSSVAPLTDLVAAELRQQTVLADPDAAFALLLGCAEGRASLKRKAGALLDLVVDEDPKRALRQLTEKHELTLRRELGCNTETIGLAIAAGRSPGQVYDWFETFEFPHDERLVNGELGLAWGALVAVLYERGWHDRLRAAWEAWCDDEADPNKPSRRFRPLTGRRELGRVAEARDHSHGCLVVPWMDVVRLVGTRNVLQRAAEWWRECHFDEDDNPYDREDAFAVLEDELLQDVAGVLDRDGAWKDTTREVPEPPPCCRGERRGVARPWLVIAYS